MMERISTHTILAPIFIAGALLATPALSYSGEEYVVCGLNPNGDNYLSIRTCGSTRCREISRLGPNTPLRAWEPFGERGWRKVDVLPYPDARGGNYLSGWVFEKYICKLGY